jgi:hypothetical protein
MNQKPKRPKNAALPAQESPNKVEKLPLPHERDESTHAASEFPDPLIVQAKRDLDAGQVDTDMRATPGLDAKRRARLVPGPSGRRLDPKA